MYILTNDYAIEDELDIDALLSANEKYREYLNNNRHDFPDDAYSFAIASWRNDRDSSKSLPDSWLESFSILEHQGKTDRSRRVDIRIKLLGPYHDGYAVINYENVVSYAISNASVMSGHGDLYRDEVRLSEGKNVIHEIEWYGLDRWLIECQDIKYEWSDKIEGLESE